jgi:acyl transferase domain-containing protein
MEDRAVPSDSGVEPIAIIGMSGRFPGARNVVEFWNNLRAGVESISFFSDRELSSAGIDPAVRAQPNFVNAGGLLEGVELFDASFFGFSPRDAEIMDPQQRIFLECAWESLEDAGYDPENYEGLIGVYAGSAMSTYMFQLYAAAERLGSLDHFQLLLGNDKDHLTTQVSYKLNLRGPSVTVQTACSTSLVAVVTACHSLLNYQCDMALAGGVAVNLPQNKGYLFQKGGIHSPDGHCRAFDAGAQGTVSGNGVGIVVLKRLSDALADGDEIRAVIRGAAMNNDGALKVGYTAPSVEGQAQVIALAQAMAGVSPDTISYIEAHGTGTALGDPIEVAALTQAFRGGTSRTGFCAIGSVKTNIGHLDPAAGIAGVIKTVLSLQHRLLPPSLHFREPNPQIAFGNSPFYVNNELREWQANGGPRRAGVSSFGIGGTNAHVVLEEGPSPAPRQPARSWQLVALSARSDAALEAATDRCCDYLQSRGDLDLADVAYTLQTGRRGFPHRRFAVCASIDDLVAAFGSRDPKRIFTGFTEDRQPAVVFLFSGQGAQYVNMGRELHETEPSFRRAVDECCDILKACAGTDLRPVLYPKPPCTEAAERQLTNTAFAQPALFVVEYALARMWMEWGIKGAAMLGHSIGEYTAACLAGVLSLEDALRLVAVRGRVMSQMPPGAMMAVSLSERELEAVLPAGLSVAAVNGPAMCVVSGPGAATEALEAALAARGVACRRLHTSHAFHSAMMDPVLEPFAEEVARVRLNPPATPYLSNLTGTWATAEEVTDTRYWTRHLRQTVRFSEDLQQLFQHEPLIVLEVGPGQALASLARQHPARTANHSVLPSLPAPLDARPAGAFALETLGRIWLAGGAVDWRGFHTHESRRRVALPTYPFEGQRYWIGPEVPAPPSRRDVKDWFYAPCWKTAVATELFPNAGAGARRWLVFADAAGAAAELIDSLRAQEAQVIAVRQGASFTRLEDHVYEIPAGEAGCDQLLADLAGRDWLPDAVAHLWTVTTERGACDASGFRAAQRTGFYSLLHLAQALHRHMPTRRVPLTVISNHVQDVTGHEPLDAAKATILGLCRVLSQELPRIPCRHIDVTLPLPAQQLLADITSDRFDPAVAYRDGRRWVQAFEPMPLPAAEHLPLRDRGVYVITGGLGAIGLTLAAYFAESAQARLALVGRSHFPDRERWDEWVAEHEPDEQVSARIRLLRSLEAGGAEVLVQRADVSDKIEFAAAMEQVHARWGAIHGVIHGAGNTVPESLQPAAQISTECCDAHFSPKALGLISMERALRGREPDFVLLFSSLASILGGAGFAGYAAANCFLDAFAAEQNRTSPFPWISVNWDGWQFAGGEGELITPADGVEAFRRIMAARPRHQVAVSTTDLSARYEQWVGLPLQHDHQRRGHLRGYNRPNLPNAYVAPHTETEGKIAELWQDLLRLEPVGVNDNFFELGGHSLLAIQLVSRLQEDFSVEIGVPQLFDAPTVASLASLVDSGPKTEAHDKMLTQMLDLVENLSDAEVARILAGGEPILKDRGQHA